MPRRGRPTCPGHGHAFVDFHPLDREGLVVAGRRNMLKAGLAGMAGLSLPALLRMREARAGLDGGPPPKSVILLWMTGGPSQIDTWDPKPDRPVENRGPFGTIQTKLPGIRQMQIVQEEDGRLEVNLVPGPGWGDDVAAALTATLRDILGQGVALELRPMERIPQEKNGKYRFTICRVTRR